MRGMAESLGIRPNSTLYIVKKDLGFSHSKILKWRVLTDHQKQKRVMRSKILLIQMKDGTKKQEIIFLDEKIFTVENLHRSSQSKLFLILV